VDRRKRATCFASLAICWPSGCGDAARLDRPDPDRMSSRSALIELRSDQRDDSDLRYALSSSRHLPARKLRAFIDFVQVRLARTFM